MSSNHHLQSTHRTAVTCARCRQAVPRYYARERADGLVCEDCIEVDLLPQEERRERSGLPTISAGSATREACAALRRLGTGRFRAVQGWDAAV